MRLVDAVVGDSYELVNLHCIGYNLKTRLSDMGLVGCVFAVIAKSERGPILVEVRGTRLAIGRGMCEQIEIKKVENNNGL